VRDLPCVIASIDDRLHIVRDGPAFAGFARYWGAPDPADLVVAPNLAEITRQTPPTKVMLFGDPSIVDRELARISDHFGETLAFVRSDVSVGEMIALGLSKGIALATVAKRLGVERDQVIAIGDEWPTPSSRPSTTTASRGRSTATFSALR
jgi:hypothetical protein